MYTGFSTVNNGEVRGDVSSHSCAGEQGEGERGHAQL